MQFLHGLVEIREVVIRPVNACQRIKCFAPVRWTLCDSKPKLLCFYDQVPSGREAGENELAVGLIARGLFCGTPEGVVFGVSPGLAGLSRPVALVGQPEIILISP